MAALRELADASAKLAAPAPPPKALPSASPTPPPDNMQQGKIIEAARQNALNYSKQLPNYLCLEVVRRARDWNTNHPAGSEQWSGDDTVVMRLNYFEQKEDYKVMLVNNRAVENKSIDQLGGVTSAGRVRHHAERPSLCPNRKPVSRGTTGPRCAAARCTRSPGISINPTPSSASSGENRQNHARPLAAWLYRRRHRHGNAHRSKTLRHSRDIPGARPRAKCWITISKRSAMANFWCR